MIQISQNDKNQLTRLWCKNTPNWACAGYVSNS